MKNLIVSLFSGGFVKCRFDELTESVSEGRRESGIKMDSACAAVKKYTVKMKSTRRDSA